MSLVYKKRKRWEEEELYTTIAETKRENGDKNIMKRSFGGGV
jgi:hypothetical protein